MATQYWSALDVLKQVAGELGLPQLPSVAGLTDVQAIQLLSLLNSAGNELQLYYPWAQFTKEWVFDNDNVLTGEYPLPDDWNYFRDQTQWDRTDHWPLLGPKSPQEWAWLKGSLVAALPRQRYRVANDKLMIWPKPAAAPVPVQQFAMEYIQKNWVIGVGGALQSMIIADGDVLMYNPWLLIKFVKFKFYELKGFNTTGVQGDFMRIYNSLTGKDVGGKILSLSPRYTSQYLGPQSVPDGSWNVHGT
jgi:hypothetical protein